jgi:hypothetical protein
MGWSKVIMHSYGSVSSTVAEGVEGIVAIILVDANVDAIGAYNKGIGSNIGGVFLIYK